MKIEAFFREAVLPFKKQQILPPNKQNFVYSHVFPLKSPWFDGLGNLYVITTENHQGSSSSCNLVKEKRSIRLEYLQQRQSKQFKTKIEEQRNIRLEDTRHRQLKQVKDQSEDQRNMWLKDIQQ